MTTSGIEVSRKGKSAFYCPEKQLAFTSERENIRVAINDTFTTDVDGYFTINHNLGYVPQVIIFAENTDPAWGKATKLPVDWNNRTEYGFSASYSVDNYDLILQVNFVAPVSSVTFNYFLLVNEQ